MNQTLWARVQAHADEHNKNKRTEYITLERMTGMEFRSAMAAKGVVWPNKKARCQILARLDASVMSIHHITAKISSPATTQQAGQNSLQGLWCFAVTKPGLDE